MESNIKENIRIFKDKLKYDTLTSILLLVISLTIINGQEVKASNILLIIATIVILGFHDMMNLDAQCACFIGYIAAEIIVKPLISLKLNPANVEYVMLIYLITLVSYAIMAIGEYIFVTLNLNKRTINAYHKTAHNGGKE